MLPASLAAWVPVFIATPTSAWASAGASLVPSPVIATSRPSACSSRISSSLASGVASARKSSTPASAAMAAAVSGLSPVIITVGCPSRRSSREALLDAALDDVLELDDAEHAARRRRPPAACRRRRRCASTARCTLGGHVAALRARRSSRSASAAPLRICAAVEVDAAHAGLRGERDERRVAAACMSRSRRPYFSLASTTMLRPSGVSSASEASCAASASSARCTPGDRRGTRSPGGCRA